MLSHNVRRSQIRQPFPSLQAHADGSSAGKRLRLLLRLSKPKAAFLTVGRAWVDISNIPLASDSTDLPTEGKPLALEIRHDHSSKSKVIVNLLCLRRHNNGVFAMPMHAVVPMCSAAALNLRGPFAAAALTCFAAIRWEYCREHRPVEAAARGSRPPAWRHKQQPYSCAGAAAARLISGTPALRASARSPARPPAHYERSH